jgi:hypothetical protein
MKKQTLPVDESTPNRRFEDSIHAVAQSFKVDASAFLAWLRQDEPAYSAAYSSAGTRQRALLGQACQRWRRAAR